jgi:hypothetical protein
MNPFELYTKLLNIFKCKLLSQNANNLIEFSNKLPIVEEITQGVVSGVLRNPSQNTLPIWEYVLCDYGNRDSRESEVLNFYLFLN